MNNFSNVSAVGGNICLSKAGLVIGGTTTDVQIVAPNGAGIDYMIKGNLYHKADTDDVWDMTTVVSGDDATAAFAKLYVCMFSLQLDTSGNGTVRQGTPVLQADVGVGGAVLDIPPEYDDDYCVVGHVQVYSLTNTFTPGSTALSAAGVTTVYRDGAGPSRPLGTVWA